MPNPSVPNSYDQVPYTSLSHREAHPDCLATIATLFGLSPVPVERCQVLELGCAGGGNLIPVAYTLPESEFVGIDYSARQIEEGQAVIAALGIENLTLRQYNILDIDPSFGQFDYIIAHGVYSWVPPDVQDHVLKICKQNLAPNGIAYVSYNTFPGWHMMRTVREMMLYHIREIGSPPERAARARALIQFLVDSVPEVHEAYRVFLKMYNGFLNEQRETSKASDDSFLLHDELETVNDPVYFYQFMERAERHGLQYLSEAQYYRTQPGDLQPEARESLSRMVRDRLEFEQYLDFLRNQTFRQTLLCHQGIPVSYKLDAEQMSNFYVVARAKPDESKPDVRSNAIVRFNSSDGSGISTDHPVSKVALLHLGQVSPQAVQFDKLLTAARLALGKEAEGDDLDADRKALASNLLKAYSYSNNLVELHVHSPPFATEIDERPVAYPVARMQAQDRVTVTSLRHERVRLGSFSHYLLRHLDGQHDRRALMDCFLSGPVAEGKLKLEHEGEPVSEGEHAESLLSKELETNLQWLARAALLMVPAAD